MLFFSFHFLVKTKGRGRGRNARFLAKLGHLDGRFPFSLIDLVRVNFVVDAENAGGFMKASRGVVVYHMKRNGCFSLSSRLSGN